MSEPVSAEISRAKRCGAPETGRWCPTDRGLFRILRVSVGAGLRFAEAAEEKRIVRDGFFDELFDEEQLRRVDDHVYALLEGLHGSESLE